MHCTILLIASTENNISSFVTRLRITQTLEITYQKKRIKDSHILREKCPYLEFFWSVFSRVWTEYGEILSQPSKLLIFSRFSQSVFL